MAAGAVVAVRIVATEVVRHRGVDRMVAAATMGRAMAAGVGTGVTIIIGRHRRNRLLRDRSRWCSQWCRESGRCRIQHIHLNRCRLVSRIWVRPFMLAFYIVVHF